MLHTFQANSSSGRKRSSSPHSSFSILPPIAHDPSTQTTNTCLSGTNHEVGSISLPSFAEFAKSSNYHPETVPTDVQPSTGYNAYLGDFRTQPPGGTLRTPPPILPDYSQHRVRRLGIPVSLESNDHLPDFHPRASEDVQRALYNHLPGNLASPGASGTPVESTPDALWETSSRNSSEDLASQPEQSGTWESFAEIQTASRGPTQYKCLWELPGDYERSTICGYSGKKQLVKRHIETTHMKLKPYLCEYCGKGFPQKTSLDIHRSTHNGSRPHTCQFGCGKTFRDPARRHKHHVDTHNYVPKPSKRHKKNQLDESEVNSPYTP